MHDVRIVPYDAAYIPDLTRLINAQVAPIPPYWQFTTTQVATILGHNSLWEIHYEGEEPAWRWENRIVCAVDGENHVYAAARFDYRYDDGRLGMVSGRWLVADEANPAALELLLDYLIGQGEGSPAAILVHGRSDFSLGWGGVPVHCGHISAVLTQKGFTPIQKWLVMTANIKGCQTEALAPIPAPFITTWQIDEDHLSREVVIMDGDQTAGECQSWGIPPAFAACDTYAEWMQIEWLGVEAAYQRRGFARRLLQEQMQYHAQRGITHCIAHTEINNVPTQRLNQSLGFQVDAEVWSWAYRP